jgi:hypothetical protein
MAELYRPECFSIPPVVTVRATFIAHGDRRPGPLPSFPIHRHRQGFPSLSIRCKRTLRHLIDCGPSPCRRLSRPQTIMATLTAAEDIGGFRGCFQPSTSALLRIPMPLSHVPMNGLKRDHVGGGFLANLSPLIAAPEWTQGTSGSSASSFRRSMRLRSPRSVKPLLPRFTHTRCPIGQGLETGAKFPVGRNPLCLDSPYDLSAKRGLLAACLAPHRYLSGACCSQIPSVRSCLAPTAHGVPVHPREISLIPSMRFMAHPPHLIYP